jgi:hypothetical protein
MFSTITVGSKKHCPHCNADFVISASIIPQEESAVAKEDDVYDLEISTTPAVPRAKLHSKMNVAKGETDPEEEMDFDEEEIATWQPKRPPPDRLFRDKTFKAPFSATFRNCSLILLIVSLIISSITAVMLYYMNVGSGDSKNLVDQTDSSLKNLALARSFDGLSVGALDTGATFCLIVIGVPFAMAVAALGISIFRDTFEGSDEFVSWPREWLNHMFLSASFILVPLFLGALPALIMISIVPHIGWFKMPLVIICEMILFPVVFLSALESKSPVMLYSRPIWNSLKISFPVWREFYMLTISAGAVIFLFLSIPLFTWLKVICISILLPFYFMVYFRLLGRLAWYCSGGYDESMEAE